MRHQMSWSTAALAVGLTTTTLKPSCGDPEPVEPEITAPARPAVEGCEFPGPSVPRAPTVNPRIEWLDETHLVVERVLVEEVLASTEPGPVRALLHRASDGVFDGYRLVGVRRGTLAEQLGLRNGDLVHAINGWAVTSSELAQDALERGFAEGRFGLTITRRAKPVTLHIAVR